MTCRELVDEKTTRVDYSSIDEKSKPIDEKTIDKLSTTLTKKQEKKVFKYDSDEKIVLTKKQLL